MGTCMGSNAAASVASTGSVGSRGAIVDVRSVVKTYGDVRALDGVDLCFEPGIIYGLLGPNGAGKTTLIRVLATLLRPQAGSVSVAGIDVLADPTRARARIGLAGQFAAVDETSRSAAKKRNGNCTVSATESSRSQT